MRFFLSLLMGLFFLILGFAPVAFADDVIDTSPTSAATCARVAGLLHEGDLIFRKGGWVWSREIAEAGGGWTSHDGLALLDENGAWVVYEAVYPHSRKSPLCTFIGGADAGLAVNRFVFGFSPIQLERLHVAAEASLGYSYDLGFDYDDANSTFCSKLIYNIYLRAIGIGVGTVQTFKDLLADNPNINLTFWKVWFLDSIPWSRRTVTPANQFADPNFVTVFADDIQQ